jgi:hypothetical protein
MEEIGRRNNGNPGSLVAIRQPGVPAVDEPAAAKHRYRMTDRTVGDRTGIEQIVDAAG